MRESIDVFRPRQYWERGDNPAPSEAGRNEGLSDMRLRNDAVSALENLGIGQSDALRAVASAYNTFPQDPPLDDLIKVALKELSK